jgi:hypothetical protein
MANEHISLDDVYQSEGAKGSVFRAVKMMAEESRFINEQARLGYIKLTRKPTTIAMTKFKADKLDGQESELSQNHKFADNDSDWGDE